MANAIPEGYHSVTPYLIVDDASGAIDFYTRAFGAEEKFRLPMGDKIGHAELQIGDSVVMLADEFPERDIRGPKARGGATSSLMIYVEDVDTVFQRAIDAGGTVDGDMGVKDQFYGDRSGTLVDPFGQKWTVATHVEDVPEDELQRRMEQFSKQSEPA
ncbi:MAG: VOC family protein [Sphingomicrobium sp.]